MLTTLVKKMFGSRNDRIITRMRKTVELINQRETEMQALSDDALRAKTEEFKVRYQAGESLDRLLVEAFAVVREASVRALGMRHFDVQMIGGMVLHEGNIAEMRTGEGKTLSATLPVYLNAIPGKGVHVVTVNDYLAKRDSEWMRPVFEFLGLSVGVILSEQSPALKREAYAADITYGTNNEYGFDYLRDNMAFSPEDKVQRDLYFAVVDEVDSILIDEARTPLIISGAAEDSSALYIKINTLIPKLTAPSEGVEGDYVLDPKQKQAHLTDLGHQHVEELLTEAGLLTPGESLYHASNILLMHHINAALRAHLMYHRDVDYIVQNKEVVIVDEHTGRTMPGRRWSEGLHQAMEAKEGAAIQNENQTLASITFQNLFRMYNKLSGMTGTADTEAYEFHQIYNLEVVVIPTNQVMRRVDEPDLIYLGYEDKFQAIIADIKNCIKKEQPVLVGTVSIEASEHLSQLLKKENIKHQVLNAKYHEKEAQIIAEAGRPGAVTIATNMAGRGTDIVLGGSLATDLEALPPDASPDEKAALKAAWKIRHEVVVASGGLRIIGSERHESRRIDNQLRGRSGRQGDPGSSRFYLSLEDQLMRIFASERVIALMKKLGMKPGEPIEHRLVTRSIENAQRKLEGHHFDVRKQLLQYDNVANEQRQVIYTQRAGVMAMEDTRPVVLSMLEEVIAGLVNTYAPAELLEEQWDIAQLTTILANDFRLPLPIQQWLDESQTLVSHEIKDKILTAAMAFYEQKATMIGAEFFAQFEKSIILQTLDGQWREHLAAMDYLRQGIHLRGYAQKDPRQEYKREAFELFSNMLQAMQYEVVQLLFSLELQAPNDIEAVEDARKAEQPHSLNYIHAVDGSEAVISSEPIKVGRNENCPCGSGKKYKTCHGRLA